MLVDPIARAEAQSFAGAIQYSRGQLRDASTALLKAARMLEAEDPRRAQDTMLAAMQAAIYAGRFARGDGPRQIAEAARKLGPASPSNPTICDLLLTALTSFLLEGRSAAVASLRRVLQALRAEDAREEDILRWSMRACVAGGELWDEQTQYQLAGRWVRLARDRGALTTLRVALAYLGWCEVFEGRTIPAELYLDESKQISNSIGSPVIFGATGSAAVLQLAWRGRIDEARQTAAEIGRDAHALGQGMSVSSTNSALTILELSLGNYQMAATYARAVFDEDLLYIGTSTLPDLVEAATRSGDQQIAHQALERFRDRVRLTETSWALGLLDRSEALLAPDDAAERLFRRAIDRLQVTRVATDLARTHLLYGEWLRRQDRKRDAREQLGTAHSMFESMGAQAFTERARAELAASGERVRKRKDETRDHLTPQESRIARLAGEGLRNQEIAGQLVISPSTVEYHLVKVFRKLGISSRTELAHSLVNAR